LFFDNADDVQLDISKFFPNCAFGNILITTRNQDLIFHASEGADSKVSDMDPDDAKELLFTLSITQELHYFPLAVSQAGSYIQRQCTLRKYLELYPRHRDHLLQHKKTQGQSAYGLAVYATWDMSYNKLSSAGKTLLQICSFSAPRWDLRTDI
ncbi:hypothetical protein B0H14DRAFT_2368852, partial [Mycena olivaceomarginata]